MARAELGLIFATPNNGDAYAGAYENANFTVEQAQSMLEDNDDIPFPEYKDIYEQALQNNPEEFAQNFSIIDKMRDDAEVTATNRIDNDGNEHFVSVFRNAFGVGLNFAVTEGRIIFDDIENLTHEQYEKIAQFCWMNSLNIRFPDNVAEYFRNNLQNAISTYEQTQRMGATPPTAEQTNETNDAIEAEREADDITRLAAEQLPEEERGEFIFNERRRRATERMQNQESASPDENKIKNRMKTFSKRLGKTEGEDFFSHRSLLTGELVYLIYKDSAAAKKDGKMQKDGSFPATYDIELRFKFDNKNTLNATWGTPNGAPIPREYADEMVGILKASGSNYIEFEQPMLDKDKGTFRDVCASNGVIPLGFYLNKHHVTKMINTASGTLTGNDLLDYKARMAEQLRKQLEEQNIPFNSPKNDLRKLIQQYEREVASTPRDHRYIQFAEAHAGIQQHINSVVNTPETDGRADAVKVVAAGQAFCEFYEIYKTYCDTSVAQFMQTDALNLPEEKEQFLQQTGLTADSNTKLMDLTKEQLVTLYKCMIPEQEAKAEAYFQTHFSDPYRDEGDSDFVERKIKATMNSMYNKARDLRKNSGEEIDFDDLGTPKYHGNVVARHRGQNNNNYNNYNRRNQRY